MAAFFKIPLNLPHAGTITARLVYFLGPQIDRKSADHKKIAALLMTLTELLEPYRDEGENPAEEEARRAKAAAAQMGRELVDEIERLGMGGDRVGQCVRNLFECLELGEEGAEVSLRAGENPDSVQRPG